MKSLKLTLAILTTSIASSAAMAQGYTQTYEPALVESAYVMRSDWNGFYAGAQYGTGSANVEYAALSYSLDNDLDAYGVHVGYMWNYNKWLFGGELDYNELDVDNESRDVKLKRLRARAGYDLDRFMPYVVLGAAGISMDGSGTEVDMSYGIGVDFKYANDKSSIGLEYSRQKFSDLNDIEGLDSDIDMIQLRADWRF